MWERLQVILETAPTMACLELEAMMYLRRHTLGTVLRLGLIEGGGGEGPRGCMRNTVSVGQVVEEGEGRGRGLVSLQCQAGLGIAV